MSVKLPIRPGESPFNMNRKYRRFLFSLVRQGKAKEGDIEQFKQLGKDAFPWLESKEVIKQMIRKATR